MKELFNKIIGKVEDIIDNISLSELIEFNMRFIIIKVSYSINVLLGAIISFIFLFDSTSSSGNNHEDKEQPDYIDVDYVEC